MSRTIQTKSGSEFWTNVNSESMIGELCKLTDEKYYDAFAEQLAFYKKNNLDASILDEKWYSPKMAYSMTAQEALDTANKLRSMLDKTEEIFPDFRHYFETGCTHEDLKYFLTYISEYFEKSEGYKCL
jgi:arsenate reductase-like glutaredoxin family protein